MDNEKINFGEEKKGSENELALVSVYQLTWFDDLDLAESVPHNRGTDSQLPERVKCYHYATII